MDNTRQKHMRDILIASVIIAATVVCCAVFIIKLIRKNSESAGDIVSILCIAGAGVCIITAAVVLLNTRLRASQEKENLEHVIDHLNAMAVLWDTNFSYVRVNNSLVRITGYSEEELRDPANLKKILPADAFSDNLQAIVNNKDEEFFFKAKDGSVVCTVWNTSIVSRIVTHNETQTIMISIGPDLTEVNKMRNEIISYSKKLGESERKYALTTGLSEIGLLLREADNPKYYCSARLRSMLGIVSEDGYIEESVLRKAFHPQDRVIFDSFASGMKTIHDDVRSDEVRTVDFRAISADGMYHWYNFRYKAVSDSGEKCIGGAIIDITADKEKDLVIERMAYIDEVTQIYNRNKFMLMGNEILECTRDDSSIDYWIIVFDIDNFHIINDTCGYANGNLLLRKFASALSVNVSESGFAARIGGDNFALIVHTDGDDQLPVRIIKSVQADIADIGGMGLEAQNLTCSAGYCLMSDGGGCEFAQVLDRAEFALSLSDGTKNSILRFDNHAHDAIIQGNEIERELAKAIDNNELVLYYQPKIDLATGNVVGMEALIRWIKPDGTVVPPCNFIPVAEKSMLITKISHFVLYEACRRNKAWQDMGLAPITVSINLTAIDFYQTNVTEVISTALRETGLAPQWLDVELTESLALKDIDHAVAQMKEIKELGVKLSMDDFGTGYSSLSYIQILPITVLKLDRSFIMYLEDDAISREIVSAVIRIAKSKKIETIAEGIETIGQADILRESGCDQAQGYFFGKPMPADKFEQFLRERQPQKTKA